ncbi:MAG: type II secretion system F family protein [Alphaproteobacteria bacterium]|nr:type II secretion system F family protein [Alphaproteobacteria bacterium]
MPVILAVLAAIIVFCGYLIVDMLLADKKRKALLQARLAAEGGVSAESGESPRTGLNGEPSAFAASLLRLLRGLGIAADAAIELLERRFAQAGINSPDAPMYYLFFQRIGALGLLLLALILVAGANETNKALMYMLAGLMTFVAVWGPKLYVQNRIDKRKKLLQRAFPDTLDLLLICVESGLALDASLARVCSELGLAYPEMTGELNRTRLELALLNDRARALNNLNERTDLPAFRSLVSALIQSERFGTSLSDTLRVLSEEFRLQRLSIAETKAARLPVLMTVPLIFLLMPAFFLIVLGPAIVKIMHNGSEITGN